MNREEIEQAISTGRRLGYCETVCKEGVKYFVEFAIKKVAGLYFAYYFCLEESKLQSIEDYVDDDLSPEVFTSKFTTLDAAVAYFSAKGGDLSRFGKIKTGLPF